MSETATIRGARPALATAAAVAHALVAICCVALAVYLLRLPRADGIVRIGGAVVLAVTALPYAAGGLGLWKGRFWGWVIGVAVNLIITLIFILDAISEHYVAWDDAAVAAIFPVLLVMLWLPHVRRWCGRRPGLRQRASVAAG